ncbi:MAG: TatD family hydrolase [Desulfatibacillaceae bacterium]
MRIIDSHCHIDDKSYDKDRAEAVQRAVEAGVAAMVVVGITPKNCERVVALAERHPECWCSVGVHPHDASSCSEDALARLRELAASERVVAWGECGLDFNRMFSPRELQEHWFSRQMEIAAELGMPVILHERDSEGRLLEMLRDHAGKCQRGVVHCFSGTPDDLAGYLDLGFHIGITGVLTQKERGKDLRAMVGDIPRDRILIETDAPYLTPAPQKNRHRRNEPAFVVSVLDKLAEVLGEDREVLARRTWDNTCELFGITP